MSSSSYPSWVPELVSDYIEKYLNLSGNQPRRDSVQLIRSKFMNINDHNARSFWACFGDIQDIDLGEFFRVLIRAVDSQPNKMEKMTPAARNAHREKIKSTAKTLSDLIADTPYDSALDGFIVHLGHSLVQTIKSFDVNLSNTEKSFIKSDCYTHLDLHQVLHRIHACDEYSINEKQHRFPVTLKKPNDKNASRAFFAQVLVNYFGSKTGKPQRKAVRLLCLVFYPELQELSDSDFRRIAPWPPKKIDI